LIFGQQQETALRKVSDWLKGGTATKQVFRLFGYAGSGKTTLARHLVSGVEGQVYFAAYTGKAAMVLRKKGCPEARTIHSLIYDPKGDNTESIAQVRLQLSELRSELHHVDKMSVNSIDQHPEVLRLSRLLKEHERAGSKPRFSLKYDSPLSKASLLVLDEASMVDEYIGKDLESFKCPILVLGDPAQLPPVKGSGYFTEQEPDVLLTEVHRQARDCPVIELATRARNKQPIPLGTYGDSMVVPREWAKQNVDAVVKAEQVLCGRNLTRINGNRRYREVVMGPDAFGRPLVGDRLVCLRNDKKLSILNGSLWEVSEVLSELNEGYDLRLNSVDEPRTLESVMVDGGVLKGEDGLPWWDEDYSKFDWSAFLTVHKSQGSQFKDGVLFDESSSFGGMWFRHLYTGITRFADRIILVKG
jgi:exodeoxyribonuclease-5